MNQNDSPNPTDIGGETLAPEIVNALVHVSPKPEVTAGAKPERKVEAIAPDPFAVGVRVLRMAPAWLLSVTAGCSLIIILLGWMNPGGMANTVAYAPALNDARPAQAAPEAPAAQPAAPAQPAEMTVPAAVAADAAPAPESAPAPAAEQAAPAPEALATAPEAPAKEQTPAPAAPATPQPEVKAEAESPAKSDDAAGNFTVQVGSFNNSSEANERVSGLRNIGFEARAAAVALPGRGTWYRVQVGRFADRGEASKAASSLRAKGAAAAIVVPVQN
jgi:cell division septation protein DedD